MSKLRSKSAATVLTVAAALSTLFPYTSAVAAASEFAGSAACAECHAAQWQAWRGSNHERAMAEATEETVLGDFNDVEFSAHGVTSLFYRRDGGFFARTDAADGKLQDFRIRYTFGWYPLQQYMVEFPRGHIQVLGIAWDSRDASEGGQRWFHLYPDEAMDHRHPQHWTARDQTWNYQCAECHSTDLKKNYDPATDGYATTWAEISVGCEACHGPGAEHVDRMRTAAASDSAPNYGGEVSMDTCARCHSRRGQINSDDLHGKPLGETHRLALLEDHLYFADGQIKDEVFVYGSFIQSRMHAAGVTCSDCHDPHSQRLHADDNSLCGSCHAPERFDTRSHHHHEPGTAGASCVSCHMPQRLYMVIDARADHGMRVPRPDLSETLGTPNACTGCHVDQSNSWAADRVAAWYPRSAHRGPHFAEAFAAATSGAIHAGDRLVEIAVDPDIAGIIRASAVDRLLRSSTSQHLSVLPRLLVDGDPLVRSAAVRLLANTDVRTRVELGWPLLRDPERVVRVEAGRVLAPLLRQSMPEDLRKTLSAAVDEYVQSEQVNAERPEAQMNVGNLFLTIGDTDSAERSYRAAIRLDPQFTPAYVNLADLYRAQQRDAEGERELRAGLAVQPRDPALLHSLGLLLAREQRLDEALPFLRQAAEAEPTQPRYAYVHALALHSAGDTAAALDALERAGERHPGNREILMALVTLHRDSGNLDSARQYAEMLMTRYPDDPSLRQLVQELQGSQP